MDITSGDATSLFKDFITVLSCNATHQLDWEIDDIEVFDLATVDACFTAWTMFPYSAFTQRTWRMIANYLCNHFVLRWFAPYNQAVSMVRDVHKYSVSPLMVALDNAQGGNNVLIISIREFFASVGSGSKTAGDELYLDYATPNIITSYRAEYKQSPVQNDRFGRGLISKLHIGDSHSVGLTGLSDAEMERDYNEMLLNRHPRVLTSLMKMINRILSTKSLRNMLPGYDNLKVFLRLRKEQIGKYLDYYRNCDRVLRVLGTDPLNYPITDLSEPSVSERVMVNTAQMRSYFWTLDASKIDFEFKDYSIVMEGWNTVYSVNRVGEYLRSWGYLYRNALSPLPTDLKDTNGNKIYTEPYSPKHFEFRRIENALNSLSGDAMMETLKSLMLEGKEWQIYVQYPLELTPAKEMVAEFDDVIDMRHMHGFDTAFIFRPVGNMKVNSRTNVGLGDPDTYKWSNVYPARDIQLVGTTPIYFRTDEYILPDNQNPPNNNPRGLSIVDAFDEVNNLTWESLIVPDTIYVRPFRITDSSSVNDENTFLDKLESNSSITIGVVTQENRTYQQRTVARMAPVQLFGLFRFNVVEFTTLEQVYVDAQFNQGVPGKYSADPIAEEDIKLTLPLIINEWSLPELRFN
jgi:hypothetical protein